MRALPYSPKTKRHIKSRFHALIELAMKRGWVEIQRNPLSLVSVKGHERVIEKVVLTPEQVNTVRANLPDPYTLMAELCADLGLRISEVLALQRLSWHCFRHSFRSWLDVIGTAPGQQMTLMRLADISTTMNVYGAGLMDSKRDILTKLHGQTLGSVGFRRLSSKPQFVD